MVVEEDEDTPAKAGGNAQQSMGAQARSGEREQAGVRRTKHRCCRANQIASAGSSVSEQTELGKSSEEIKLT